MNIYIDNLSKLYGRKYVLDNVSLTITTGMFGLLGRNGAGKTTLMRILATVAAKTTGKIDMAGIQIEKANEIRKIIGYLPQNFSIYPNMTVYQAMDYLGVLSELTKKERIERIPQLLQRVNLDSSYKKKIKCLSGGMKQRLGIAQALLNNPKILIVDEPTVGLDPEERVRFRNMISEIAEDRIVILSTHIVGDIAATCENIAVLDEGKVVYSGTANELSQQASGKVYSMEIHKEEIPFAKKNFHILNIQTHGAKTEIRLLSDVKPSSLAVTCKATIEDGYIELLRKKEGREIR
ncbi:ABC transporter ATP-binding protein [Clostridium oryzae]|uniref:Putative ABC transporter ATP-binding protein YxlF n=1 Tax=Clostridium oryzae TaxID=1450648 RepID=A0A1V4IIV5_9CLOT|nr:ABC transporter ATP-binding protein [Clostridium oryzae]OPJ59866.1 putative ABC transporter ATP-binding protein YxlF [Clostridium oryzae]